MEEDTPSGEGCGIDWSWLVGRRIEAASSDLATFRLHLSGGLTLEVRAATWRGKPFLAFDPWHPPMD